MSALTDLLDDCQLDPEIFVEDFLGCQLRGWQRAFYREIRDQLGAGNHHIRALARTCHGAGKSYAMAGLALWWTVTRPESRGLTTAPSWSGVENLLWPEITKLYNSSGILRASGFGRLLTTKLEISRSSYLIGGASDRPVNLEGHHSPTAAARFVDEAKGVDPGIFEATFGMLDAPETMDVWISTPSIRSGNFWDRDENGKPDSAGFPVIRAVVTIEDLIADGVAGKVSWRDKALEEYGGRDSDIYGARAMAQYIQNSEGALFPSNWVERAMRQPWTVDTTRAIGFDVAGSKDGDESVLAESMGPDEHGRYSAEILDAWREQDTMLSKGRALAVARRRFARSIHVDTIGLGQGVRDALARDFSETYGYRASEAPSDTTRFVNRKAEDAWFLRDLLEQGMICLGADPVLKNQLTSMKYEIDRQGRTRVVDPADSPDRVDALLIAVTSGRNVVHMVSRPMISRRSSF